MDTYNEGDRVIVAARAGYRAGGRLRSYTLPAPTPVTVVSGPDGDGDYLVKPDGSVQITYEGEALGVDYEFHVAAEFLSPEQEVIAPVSPGLAEPEGVWVAYCKDTQYYAVSVFASEIEALRHAVNHYSGSMRVRFLPYGTDLKDVD